ncbi:MAG: AraC family transcriptional regulator [bacterium]|jgi:AraC family transcriptional regulator
MDQRLRECVGEGPPPFDEEQHQETAIYTADRLSVYICQHGVDFTSGAISHSNYEFFLPLGKTIPLLKVEMQKRPAQYQHLFPFNPEQPHGLARAEPGLYFLDIMVDKDYFDEICTLIYGKSEVCFYSENNLWTHHLDHLVESFAKESLDHQAGQAFMLDCLGNQILVELLRSVRNNMPLVVGNHPCPAKPNIKRAIEFLREHFNLEFCLEDVAKVANLSSYHFIRMFRAQTGKTPYQFVRDIKIEKACSLLRFTDLPITEVCFLSGFNDPSHFASAFRKKMGASPTCYRRSFRA